jgi:hypothetical protein
LTLDDLMPDPDDLVFKPVPLLACQQRWPRARYELLTYARFVATRGRMLHAAQIRLAVQLADAQMAEPG